MEALINTESAILPPGGEVLSLPLGHICLRAAYWLPPSGQSSLGTVALFNGRTEFIEKYCEVIQELLDRGYAVATLDWRGQGLSSRSQENRLKGHVDDFADYDEDIDTFIKDVLLPNCPAPYFLLAHSMGGNIALRYLSRPGNVFDKAVLVAPMTGVHTKPIPMWAAKLVAWTGHAIGRGGSFVPGGDGIDPLDELFEKNAVTSDVARFDRYKSLLHAQPEIATGAPTLGWLRQAFRTMKEVSARDLLGKISCPVLIVSAGEDTIADSTTHPATAAAIPMGEMVTVPGAKHEIMMETDDLRQIFWRAFDEFLSADGQQQSISPKESAG